MNKLSRCAISVVLFLVIAPMIFADTASITKEQINQAKLTIDQDKAEDFKGLGFGLGISTLFHFGGKIEEVINENGKVFVKKAKSIEPLMLLETHYFFTNNSNAPRTGYGPFACILTSNEDNLLAAVGIGIMAGFRKPNTSSSFNVGLALMFEGEKKVLREGVVEDEAIPEGFSELYKTTSGKGVALVISFAF